MNDLDKNIDDLNQSSWETFKGLTVQEGYHKWVQVYKTLKDDERAYWKKFYRKHIYGME